MIRSIIPLSMVLAALLSACGANVDHPSLAPRAIEQQPAAVSAPTGESRVPVDSPELARMNALTAEARAADRAFRDALAVARKTIGAGVGASAGSEAWVVAQQALTRLDVLRAPLVQALADLDGMAADALHAGRAPDPMLEAALAELAALDSGARAEIMALEAALSRP